MLSTTRTTSLKLRPRSLWPAVSQCQHLFLTGRTVTECKKDGDISSVFRSLSGGSHAESLPPRFADVKRSLLARAQNRDVLYASWNRLLQRLQEDIRIIRDKRPTIIPEIQFSDLDKPSSDFSKAFKKRGVAVIRNVVPEKEARSYKEDAEKYIAANPSTRAFPPHDPQVFELYWSRPQLTARAHPNMIKTQRFLMSYYQSSNPDAECSTQNPLMYADRLRIRQPGDAGFALGPHVDGGSVERWEPEGYGRGRVYDKIFDGAWEDFDPWELSTRLDAVSDLYQGAGACSMFRMFQGWLSMSYTGPHEGTLLVNPLFNLTTAYYLLRPFFTPKHSPPATSFSPEFLDPHNWTLENPITPDLQGSSPGHCQELRPRWHPHLDLPNTMVHVPRIAPGDYVAWHCDTIHAVDALHRGKRDSSVMYIPACPTTRANLDYVVRQRRCFEQGIPAPDFPGGKGESEHVGRPGIQELKDISEVDGLRGAGYAPFDVVTATSRGEAAVLAYGSKLLGF
ncbi:DUF1479-domain-containing protein [Sodiomyces alkalinus F11]|uniref:DUF1479-domain-containing protein n=1 Tax=Sodiomyces alkalinus (strain CBS 110278 / VKM F-3762 / F11) TaxID=1314773 RepID=A0A3N2Q6M6_SODAK|nr:DUF1479-domain-containing protein [Sodiomyces alkalinus F11]ROT42357.1 DUF1479-domain-containing protein [Sodiomyces alkalinus F11]